MSPTAHSRSPARRCPSTSTVSRLGVEPDGLEADVREVGAAAGRDQQLVGVEHLAADAHVELAVVVDPLDLDAGPYLDPLVAQDRRQRLAGLRLLVGRDPVGHLEQRHLRAVAREHLRELQPVGSPADHDQPAGDLGGLHGLAVGPVRRVGQPGDRGPQRLGAGVEEYAAGGAQHRRVAVVLDPDHAGSVEPAVAADDPDARRARAARRAGRRSSRGWPSGCGPRPATSPARPCASPASRSARRTSAIRSAGRTISLDGVQPQNGHSPPTSASSTPITSSPASRELARGVLAARPEPQHHHVTVSCRLRSRSWRHPTTRPKMGG